MRCSDPSSSTYLWVVLLVGFLLRCLLAGCSGCCCLLSEAAVGLAQRGGVCVFSLCVVTLNELDTCVAPYSPQTARRRVECGVCCVRNGSDVAMAAAALAVSVATGVTLVLGCFSVLRLLLYAPLLKFFMIALLWFLGLERDRPFEGL